MANVGSERKWHIIEPYKRGDGTPVRRHAKPMPCPTPRTPVPSTKKTK